MKRAIGLIAATLLTTSLYSQDYSSSSSSSNPDSTPDYRSRQSESGAPASGEYSSSSSAGYDKAPGLSGGNSSTGQSNGTNIGSTPEQDQSLTTRDSDLSGSEYRGTLENEPNRSFDSELNPDSSGSSGSSVSGSNSSSSTSDTSGELKGSGTADGAFHEPAAPVREGQKSEGWSGSGTFSGAGPGSVTGSDSSNSSSNSTTIPSPTENSNDFSSDVSNNAALNNRDQDLSNRGLEPDSNQLSRGDELSNSVEGDMDNDTVILEDWTIMTPPSDTNVGAPAESESGTSSSSNIDTRDRFDSTMPGSSSDSYSQDLYNRVQRDWSARSGTLDVPATPGLTDQSLEDLGHVRFYNDTTQSDAGAPGSSVSGSGKSSDDDIECDKHKGSAPEYEQGSGDRSNEDSSKYHFNRGEDERYHINREASGDRSDTSAPGEYGDRPDSSNYDDGHLSGNNAAGSSGSSETSSDSNKSNENNDEASRSTDGALTQPDL